MGPVLQKSLGAGTGGLLSQDVSSQALHAGLGDVNSLCHAMRSPSRAEWLPHAFPALMEYDIVYQKKTFLPGVVAIGYCGNSDAEITEATILSQHTQQQQLPLGTQHSLLGK